MVGQSSSAFPLLTESLLKFGFLILERSQAVICFTHRVYSVPDWKTMRPPSICGLDRLREETGKAFLCSSSSDEGIGMGLTYEAGPLFRKKNCQPLDNIEGQTSRVSIP
jgi:hypothetical protein